MSIQPFAALVLSLSAFGVLAQSPYAFGYNPGPTRGSKWMAKASDGQTESAVAVLMEAPRAVWARVCYSIGPSDSEVMVYAQTGKGVTKSTALSWGGCADVFGTSIWIGNGHFQAVGGHYAIAPATPGK